MCTGLIAVYNVLTPVNSLDYQPSLKVQLDSTEKKSVGAVRNLTRLDVHVDNKPD